MDFSVQLYKGEGDFRWIQSFRQKQILLLECYLGPLYTSIIGYILFVFQDTVVALHALSVYNIRTFARDINLNISLSSSSNSQFQGELVLTQGDAAVQKSVDNVRIPVLYIIPTLLYMCMYSVCTKTSVQCTCNMF